MGTFLRYLEMIGLEKNAYIKLLADARRAAAYFVAFAQKQLAASWYTRKRFSPILRLPNLHDGVCMKKFVSWLGGIVETVIAGVAVYYWTTPTPARAPAPEIAFEGMVIDGSGMCRSRASLCPLRSTGPAPAMRITISPTNTAHMELSYRG